MNKLKEIQELELKENKELDNNEKKNKNFKKYIESKYNIINNISLKKDNIIKEEINK